MTKHTNTPPIIAEEHKTLLQKLRVQKPAHQKIHTQEKNLGAKVSDAVAATVGSWPFIIIQSSLLFLWICANILGWVKA